MADIKVNLQQWNSVSLADQEKITQGLRETGALKIGDRIVGDPSVLPFDKNTQFEQFWNPLEDLCKAACDVAASAGAAWCIANTGGIALAACLTASEAARNVCRNQC